MARMPATPRERQDLLRTLERDAILLPSAFFLDATELDKQDHAGFSAAQELILDLRSFLIVGSREPWRSERSLIAVEVQKLSAAEQRQAWQAALGEGLLVDHHASAGQSAADFLDALVQQFDFSMTQIRQTSESARANALLGDAAAKATSTGDVWRAARAQFSNALRGLADRIVPAYTFEDLVLPDDTLRQLREIAAQVSLRGVVYERWGFGERLSRGRGIAALFSGPSGTGKTMAAEVLANYLNLDLYRVDLSGVVSKYIGETEKNLRRVFDAAEESGAILFFDEADALFGKRSEVHDSHDRFANIEINYLLQRMEDYRGLAILATNMKSQLDQAFLRRLRFLVDFPFPSVAERKRIWQGVFPSKAETQNVDYAFLSRLEIAGGNIKNIAMNAAFLAATGEHPIGMQHLLSAARREYTKIDKLVLESEFGRYFAAVQR
jgi:ATP-dependent 26S proteasome regulatory subunit